MSKQDILNEAILLQADFNLKYEYTTLKSDLVADCTLTVLEHHSKCIYYFAAHKLVCVNLDGIIYFEDKFDIIF